MKYSHLSPKVRSMINLLVIGTIGAVLLNVLNRTVSPNGGDANRFLFPLLPLLMGGTALTLFSTFTYGVINLANEPEAKSRKWIMGIMALTLIVAYLFLFFMFEVKGAIG